MSNISQDRTDLIAIATSLRPDELQARIAYWRSDGFAPGGLTESVARSQGHPLPVSGEDGGLKDRLDRRMQIDSRTYRVNLSEAVKLLSVCAGLEQTYLTAIEVASEDLQAVVSDFPSCLYGCVRRNLKKPWKLRRGLCDAHWKAWVRDGRPELVPSEVLRESAV